MISKYLLYNCLPIIFHLLCYPFYFIGRGVFAEGTMTFIQLFANIIIIPLYLVIVGCIFNNQKKGGSIKKITASIGVVLVCYLLVILSVSSIGSIDLMGWGIVISAGIVSLVVLLFEWSVALMVKWITNNKK